ncbi:DUF7693 family protein [Pseudomonas sp. S36]|uniref:DUF7693 family protein n=1 Tax=Pseudomonas sp. S36 TaxID=2767447 RepID=UPI00191242DE|nr:hypothetical protein [Pseudomonas sp. S36]MBK4990437.1 hypothetical protein [Pseudomonas sp. S36]
MNLEEWDEAVPNPLTAREACQVLREALFGRRTMTIVRGQVSEQLDCLHYVVDVDGWKMRICANNGEPEFCEWCVSPEGRCWAFDPGARIDPIALLSGWEYQNLQRLLTTLQADGCGTSVAY